MKIEDSKKYINYMRENGLNKGYVIDVLDTYVNFNGYIKNLENFLKMKSKYGYDNGYIFSKDIDEDDDEYFGKNKVMFYYGDGDDSCDIIDYKELLQYLYNTSQFYIMMHPEEKVIIERLLKDIKEKYEVLL